MRRVRFGIADGVVRVLCDVSHDAVARVPLDSLDWVYVDADHSEEGCLQDLQLWGARVKPGGIIAGHDYSSLGGMGVIEAVHRYAEECSVDNITLTNEAKFPSYFFAKPV
jgi:hypothetical protein